MTPALALRRSAEAQQHAVFAMLNSHPTLRAPAWWMFESMAHVVVANSQRPRLKIYNKEYGMHAPEEMISGNSALRVLNRSSILFIGDRERATTKVLMVFFEWAAVSGHCSIQLVDLIVLLPKASTRFARI